MKTSLRISPMIVGEIGDVVATSVLEEPRKLRDKKGKLDFIKKKN